MCLEEKQPTKSVKQHTGTYCHISVCIVRSKHIELLDFLRVSFQIKIKSICKMHFLKHYSNITVAAKLYIYIFIFGGFLNNFGLKGFCV